MLCALPSFATITKIANSATVTTSFVGCDLHNTTDAIDTTGATLLTAWIPAAGTGDSSSIEFIDSKANTWTILTQSGTGTDGTWYYSYNKSGGALSVGAGHTIATVNNPSYAAPILIAWSGNFSTSTNPFDQQSQGANSASTVTPTANGELVHSGIAISSFESPFTCTVDSGLTVIALVNSRNVSVLVGCSGYLIQSTAATIGPFWTITNGGGLQPVSNATFKENVANNAIQSQGFVF